ncbi:unnamed protein product [Arabidopsis thaliana]|uniref:Uncharacterized protein n=1 Tax=Arabidopsis thaliana TaxID=3702 RepID=A0A654FE89_ARATH|nr:unnamed protein product [Arabidopsis thaliana]
MQLVVLMSFLLLLPLCSSRFGESHEDGVPHTDQYSLNMVEESIPKMMETGTNPSHDQTTNGWGRPTRPPPSRMMDYPKTYPNPSHGQTTNRVIRLSPPPPRMMDYPKTYPNPSRGQTTNRVIRLSPPPPRMMGYPKTYPNPSHDQTINRVIRLSPPPPRMN